MLPLMHPLHACKLSQHQSSVKLLTGHCTVKLLGQPLRKHALSWGLYANAEQPGAVSQASMQPSGLYTGDTFPTPACRHPHKGLMRQLGSWAKHIKELHEATHQYGRVLMQTY